MSESLSPAPTNLHTTGMDDGVPRTPGHGVEVREVVGEKAVEDLGIPPVPPTCRPEFTEEAVSEQVQNREPDLDDEPPVTPTRLYSGRGKTRPGPPPPSPPAF